MIAAAGGVGFALNIEGDAADTSEGWDPQYVIITGESGEMVDTIGLVGDVVVGESVLESPDRLDCDFVDKEGKLAGPGLINSAGVSTSK